MGVVLVKRLVHETSARMGPLQGVQAEADLGVVVAGGGSQDHAQGPDHVQAGMRPARPFGGAAPQ